MSSHIYTPVILINDEEQHVYGITEYGGKWFTFKLASE